MLHAPRSLNAPIGWKFSHLRASTRLSRARPSRSGHATSTMGVSRAIPRIRSRAALIASIETKGDGIRGCAGTFKSAVAASKDAAYVPLDPACVPLVRRLLPEARELVSRVVG